MAQVPDRLGKYQLLEVIGRGGVGEVYRAFQPDLNRTVAIKTLLAGEQASEDFIRRFQREASVAANLVHPNIVQVHDLGTEGRLHYIVMEYVEGRSLKEVLGERTPDVREALEIARSVARTLQFAHEKSIIHRDIKPANLLVDPKGTVRILDFGLAKSLADGKGLTVSNVMMGTPCYMSPEQAFGAPDEVDARTDVYSLGAVLYEMLTGRLLFDGGTVLAILRKIEDEDPKPPGVSPAIDALVLRALSKDRDRRFASAAGMADAIDAVLSGAETLPASPRPRTPSTPRPPSWIWVATAALLLVLLWAAWPGGKEPADDAAARLEAILERGDLFEDAALDPFRENPDLRRRIADHFLARGQFGRAFEFLEDYERTMAELASAGALQRFVSPGLFPIWMAVPDHLDGAEGFLLAAVRHHLEGNLEFAQEKLGAAEAGGADPAHVFLVRAHLLLRECLSTFDEDDRISLLRRLEEAADSAREDVTSTLPVRALIAHLNDDERRAWERADRLRELAPHAAETFLLRSILFQYEGKMGLAFEALMDAERQHPGNLDLHLHAPLLALHQILEEEERVEPGRLEELRRAAEESRGEEPHPAALFLGAAIAAIQSRFDDAQRALVELEHLVPIDQARMEPGFLDGLVGGFESRALLIVASAELQEAAGMHDEARVTSEWALKQRFPREERREIEREVHLRLARLCPEPEDALRHLEEALKRGYPVDELDDAEELEHLRDRREFRELRERYDR